MTLHCDFCYEDHPVKVYSHQEIRSTFINIAAGEWAACETCARLLENDQIDELVKKVMLLYEEKYEIHFEGKTYTTVFKNLTEAYKQISKVSRYLQQIC